MIRFDAVYTLHFKCSETIREKCPNLLDYTRELYQMPEIRKTVDFEHIKQRTCCPKALLFCGGMNGWRCNAGVLNSSFFFFFFFVAIRLCLFL